MNFLCKFALALLVLLLCLMHSVHKAVTDGDNLALSTVSLFAKNLFATSFALGLPLRLMLTVAILLRAF